MGTYRLAPMDLAARIGTASFYILTLGFIVAGMLIPEVRPLIAMAVFLMIVAWFSWRIAPKRYDVKDEAVVIVRAWPFKDISIPFSEIREVRRVTLSPWVTVRTFGVGGLFSYSGRFWQKQIGNFYGGVTDFRRTVLIAAGENFVISPADPDQFVQDIESQVRRRS